MADRVREYERYGRRWARQKQRQEQDSIDARFKEMQRRAENDFMAEDSNLRYQLGQAVGNPEKQRELSKQQKDLEKSYRLQKQSISDARLQALSRTANLENYMGGYNESEYNRMKAADEKRLQDTIDNIKSGDVGGAVKSAIGKPGKTETNEDSTAKDTSGQQETGTDSQKIGENSSKPQAFTPNLIGNNPYTPGFVMNDANKKEAGDQRKQKEEQSAKESQKKTGGAAFDSSKLVLGEDENGEKTFTQFNENPDLTYHPALEAAQAMDKPSDNDKEKDDKWADYRTAFGLGKYFANRFRADDKDPMGRSARLRRQAEMHDIEAGDHQRSMQQNLQVANRDYRSEAEKNAASQAAAENAQKVHNLGNAGAGAAALERDVKSADYNTMMQRSDAQRAEGVKNMEKMHDDRQVAEEERSGADVYDYTARDMNDYNARSGWLSMGGPQSDKRNKIPRKKEEAPLPRETETPNPPKTESDDRFLNANPQNVINMYLGANQADGNTEETGTLNDDDNALFEYMQEKFPNVKPLPSAQSVRKNYYSQRNAWTTRQDGSLNMDPWESAWASTDDEYGTSADKKALIEALRNWRGGGDSSKNFTQGQASEQVSKAGNTVSSTDSGETFNQNGGR